MTKHRKGQQARRTTARNLRSTSVSPWHWLVTGMLIGILGITAIFLFATGKWPLNKFKSVSDANPLIRESNAVLPTHTKKHSPKPKSKPKKESARFEFYQLLPGMEVPLPEATTETAANATKPTLAKTEKKLAAAQYLVQAGNFRELVNAESLKQQLQGQGLSAKIQKIEAEDGMWFRVTLGPFQSEAIALIQKNRLAREKIPGILILQRQ